MNGTTPKQRAASLQKILSRTYDEYGEHSNVTDALTDLRHLCDRYGYDFATADRTAYRHCAEEKAHNSIEGEHPILAITISDTTIKAVRGTNRRCAPYTRNGEIIRPKGYHTTRTVKG